LAVWEVVAAARAGHDVPGDDEWDQAAAAVRAQYQPGDLILFAPDWVDPVGRLHLGDLIPVDVAGRMDDARFGRIWELSIRGARGGETAGLEPVYRESFGGVTVRRFERAPAEVVTDFVTAADRAERPVARPDLQEVGFAPHRCLAASPGQGKTAVMRWPSIELGSQLVGYFGEADVFTRRENLYPARLEVLVAGHPAADLTVGPDDGWVRFAAPTPPGAAEVVFRATDLTPGDHKRKEGERTHILCFAAEARR
ncbi:MAG TPA: hypothetical protein VL172_02645, partial [Kofleriaceae bacterium]|nr:hypothetical protein [Kofleriaceae bacterium]